MYADIILPLALPKRTYTYSVPDDLAPTLMTGLRVEVQFGARRTYSGLVERIHDERPEYKVKPVIAILDEVAVATPQQLKFWDWMADYYCCTLGEVMSAALPGHLKLTSETQLVVNPDYGLDFSDLNDDEYLIAEALHLQTEISVEDVRKILNKKTIFPVVQQLLKKGVLFLREDLQEKYRPRKIVAVRLAEPYHSQPDTLRLAFEMVEQHDRQLEVLTAFVQLQRNRPFVSRRELLKTAAASESPLQSLVKKNILEVFEREVSRLGDYQEELAQTGALSDAQRVALDEVNARFEAEKKVVLLHGVTGAGKTQLYIELIRQTLLAGGQALYLLPEIALTQQMVARLQRVFGQDVAVYHSKINYNERVELWRAAAEGKGVILAARSGLFLPFRKLQLIVVDEEHDPSYKQYDPAPRYHARDAAIYLARIYGAKTLLGTATPALETHYNALTGKYGLATLKDRFGGLQLPEITTIDLREQLKKRQMHALFSTPLIDAITAALANDEQVILFQNRRGYSPVLECQTCGWTSMCIHCDVSLTFHKQHNRLRCHYCGHQANVPETCPACGSGKLSMLGFGTEKIEDELKIFFPQARIGRLDLDTAGSKAALAALLNDFEERQIDILVGTQMVTKGLDFDNVALVGVLGADQLVRRPDFRSGERAFQLITQVAGRAGRKKRRGQVLVQAFDPHHPVIRQAAAGDIEGFMRRELDERAAFHYPPFMRLIQITLQHKDEKTTASAAAWFARELRAQLGPERTLGPVQPHIPRIRGYYGQNILLKLEKDPSVVARAKALIRHVGQLLAGKPGWSQVRVNVDVDPI